MQLNLLDWVIVHPGCGIRLRIRSFFRNVNFSVMQFVKSQPTRALALVRGNEADCAAPVDIHDRDRPGISLADRKSLQVCCASRYQTIAVMSQHPDRLANLLNQQLRRFGHQLASMMLLGILEILHLVLN